MDFADEAQRHEAYFLAQALARVPRDDPDARQLVEDGQVCCLDCLEPIPPERLARVPRATRCRVCQEEAERGRLRL